MAAQTIPISGDVRSGAYLAVRDSAGQYREASDIGRADHVASDTLLRIAGGALPNASGEGQSFDLADLPELPKANFRLEKDGVVTPDERQFEEGHHYSLANDFLPYSIRLDPAVRPPSPSIREVLERAANG